MQPGVADQRVTTHVGASRTPTGCVSVNGSPSNLLCDYVGPLTTVTLTEQGAPTADDGEDYLDERGRNPRWHDLELYRTAGGRYVLYVRYTSEWDREVGFDEVAVAERPRDVAEVLRNWEPTAPVRGYPDGPQFVRKQELLLADVRARFGRCVSDLFAQLGPEYAEHVD